jgi:phosphoribosylformimino-5-aminoimidazole carboxamide ribotide isomerase
MHLMPRIDMTGGESRFSLSNPDDPDRPLDEAVEVALRFQELGARRIQVIDVDRATEHGDNDEVLVDILQRVGVPVDAGGGVRSMRRIQQLLDTGVARVVLSTMGLEHLDWLKEVGILFGDRVVQAIDLHDGQVLVKGRTEPSKLTVDDFIRKADGFGLGAFLVNTCDQEPSDQDLAVLADVSTTTATRIWFGGTHATLARLEQFADTNVYGVVLGRELYDGRLDLAETFNRFQPVVSR